MRFRVAILLALGTGGVSLASKEAQIAIVISQLLLPSAVFARGSGYSSCHGRHCGWSALSAISLLLLLPIIWFLAKGALNLLGDAYVNKNGESFRLGAGVLCLGITLVLLSLFLGPVAAIVSAVLLAAFFLSRSSD